MWRRSAASALAVGAVVCAVAGCSGSSTGSGRSTSPGGSTGSGGSTSEGAAALLDCASQVRLDGALFSGAGYTERHATRFATADEADCEDLGPSPRGSVFSEDPRQVAVWSFDGYPPDEVVGVRFDEDSFEVFVADSVPRQEAERLVRELSAPGE